MGVMVQKSITEYITCYIKKGTITTDLLPWSSLATARTFQLQVPQHCSFSVFESAGLLSTSLHATVIGPGHTEPWFAFVSCVLPKDSLTNDPCLVLNDLAHFLPWEFLSLHKPPGYSCISQFTLPSSTVYFLTF